MTDLLFVYGTLKEGFPNFGTNRGTRVPGTFTTAQPYPLYLVGERHTPWMIDAPGEGHRIGGEVFRVDADALAQMDVLEGAAHPDGYRRRVIVVHAAAGDPLTACAYVKEPGQLTAGLARQGPFAEYTLAHAALYRPRQR